jgi:hypothetical protein
MFISPVKPSLEEKEWAAAAVDAIELSPRSIVTFPCSTRSLIAGAWCLAAGLVCGSDVARAKPSRTGSSNVLEEQEESPDSAWEQDWTLSSDYDGSRHLTNAFSTDLEWELKHSSGLAIRLQAWLFGLGTGTTFTQGSLELDSPVLWTFADQSKIQLRGMLDFPSVVAESGVDLTGSMAWNKSWDRWNCGFAVGGIMASHPDSGNRQAYPFLATWAHREFDLTSLEDEQLDVNTYISGSEFRGRPAFVTLEIGYSCSIGDHLGFNLGAGTEISSPYGKLQRLYLTAGLALNF